MCISYFFMLIFSILVLPTCSWQRSSAVHDIPILEYLTHTVQTGDIFNGVISLYQNDRADTTGVPLGFKERAVNLGSVAQDMFSAFYEETN